MKNCIVLLLGILLLASCGGDGGGDPEPVLPTNLNFTIENETGSGEVTVTATAENTKLYTIYFGDSPNTPVNTETGIATHTYKTTGTYQIKVEARSTVTDVISKTQSVEITVNVVEKEWELVWADEFNNATINPDNWTFEIGNNGGWGNNELQYYTAENASINMDGENGFLVIEARKEEKEGFHYTSSRMVTKDKKEFLFGRVDIRAKLPKGQGIWPALWMLGANISDGGVGWPKCGEIDIMEMIGGGANRDNRVYGTAHWYNDSAPGAIGGANYGGNVTLSSGVFADDYHVFSVEWNEDFIIWSLDEVEFHRIDITPSEAPERFDEFRKDQFLIFNVAVGGNWPGVPDGSTTFPQSMSVDYIRFYQYK